MNLQILGIEDPNTYLQQFLSEGECCEKVSVAGMGNMNLVLRLETNQNRSFIVKKAFPYVYKYPSIEAPVERNELEAIFYRLLSANGHIQTFLPKALLYDNQKQLLWLEDLGETADYAHLYDLKTKLSLDKIKQLVSFLSILHRTPVPIEDNPLADNLLMRELNHKYIFINPFQADNGLNLDAITDGLAAVAGKYVSDKNLLAKINDLGNLYLQKGKTLLHGDFYPCSWLETPKGLKIIDFEFAFCGWAEFDLSVLYAHLILTEHADSLFFDSLASYENNELLNLKLIEAWAGVEIFRRLLGVAQLPLAGDLSTKKMLLEKAYHLITNV